MRTNKKATNYRVNESARLAGGYGIYAAKQNAEALLRRAVLACLLWEDLCYEDGKSVVENIKHLVPQVEPNVVAALAIEARTKQKLRHVPLLLACEMARHDEHRKLLGSLLPEIILRADELSEFMALYWSEGKCPIAKQVKVGLAQAFQRFDAYSLAKHNRDAVIKLRDVMFLCHAKPKDGVKGYDKEARRAKMPRPEGKGHELFEQLTRNELPIPDTWEVSLSTGKNKQATWERLISEGKLGALAFVRNLRNMEEANVNPQVIQRGFETINPRWLLPLNYLAAARVVPRWMRELETLMLRGLAQAPKLSGYTILVVDVSGSMGEAVSSKSELSRLDAGTALTILAAEMCERVAIYATAGNDAARRHQTALVSPYRGFALAKEIAEMRNKLGGGGIFTRQCLEYIKGQEHTIPDRIIVFSDSQDCDHPGSQVPHPFGKRNYIVDVSAHAHGVVYGNIWTSEISGWSEHFLTYIAASEGANISQGEEEINS